MQSITTALNEYYKAKQHTKQLAEQLKHAREVEAQQKQEALQAMQAEKIKSLSSGSHRFTITTRKDVKIDPYNKDLIQYLKDNGLEGYVREIPETLYVKPFATKKYKEDGELLPGCEYTETESLSITKKP